MDKTTAIVDFLKDWQNMSYDAVESADDIKVFNIVGTIAQLVSNEYMLFESAYDFVEYGLSLDDEIKERICNVLNNAYEASVILH